MKCSYCSEEPVYRCSVCGKPICNTHAKLRTVCPSCLRKETVRLEIKKATSEKEKAQIQKFVKRFWGEEEQFTFAKRYIVADLPTYIAQAGASIAGFVSIAETDDALIIVALGVLPEYQDAGAGRSLIAQVEAEAKKLKKKRLLVSTSNDDLPALAFYQALGFQIYDVKPNVIAEKHGNILLGIGGLPIRDELRLRRTLK